MIVTICRAVEKTISRNEDNLQKTDEKYWILKNMVDVDRMNTSFYPLFLK